MRKRNHLHFSPTIRLHFIVFLWGFTGILGKLISLDSMQLVWYRTLITVITIGLFMKYKKISFQITKKKLLEFFAIGFIIGAHWYFFFLAIKVSNVSIALCTLSAGALFSALLEPFFFKRKLDYSEIILSIIVILCMLAIFKIAPQYYIGIIYGLICTFLSTLFAILNAKLIRKDENSAIETTFYELLGAWVLTNIVLLFNQQFVSLYPISNINLFWLILLGVFFTAYPMIESISLMKYISPYTLLLTVNLEPVYGIFLAYFIFGESEKMKPEFYFVVLVLVLSIVMNELLKRRIARLQKKDNKLI